MTPGVCWVVCTDAERTVVVGRDATVVDALPRVVRVPVLRATADRDGVVVVVRPAVTVVPRVLTVRAIF